WRLGESNAKSLEARELRFEVARFERSKRNALLEHRLLEHLRGWVGVRFQSKLEVLAAFRRHDGQPLVLPHREVVLLLKAEHLGVELQRSVLILDDDAGELDSHR